ncbi:MAG TPA: trypsin-like peptidase domain-containing protein [Acidimicrobiales bacterium]|nr:trypsin-like peptidase domain-containing protein [Acidimicrobiales bacterium]
METPEMDNEEIENGAPAAPDEAAGVSGAEETAPAPPATTSWSDPSAWASGQWSAYEDTAESVGPTPSAFDPTAVVPTEGVAPAAGFDPTAGYVAGSSAAEGSVPPPPYAGAGIGGYAPFNPAPVQTGAVPSESRKRSTFKVASLVLAGVVVCSASGAAIGIALDHGSNAPAASNNNGSSGGIQVAKIAADVEPAVMSIHSTLEGSTAAGTGMIVTSSGEVLTNNHVVNGATNITAQIDGVGKTYEMKVLGVDPGQDVALLQIEGGGTFATVSIGNSTNVKIGDPVVAIGNALDLKGGPTVTSGSISQLNRSITATDELGQNSENLTGLLQTDAPINPGNSGGPLINASGQVIGMNTAADNGSSTQAATNIGFAIPINTAMNIVHEIEGGKGGPGITLGQHGLIGVEVESVSVAESSQGLSGPFGSYTAPVTTGAVVVQVDPGTPAEQAGIQTGDVITSFAGHAIRSPQDLSAVVTQLPAGDSVSITWVDSGKQSHTATVTLAMHPAV